MPTKKILGLKEELMEVYREETSLKGNPVLTVILDTRHIYYIKFNSIKPLLELTENFLHSDILSLRVPTSGKFSIKNELWEVYREGHVRI